MHKFIDYDKQNAAEILAKRDFEGAEKLANMSKSRETPYLNEFVELACS